MQVNFPYPDEPDPKFPWHVHKTFRSGTSTIVDARGKTIAIVLSGGEKVAKGIVQLCNQAEEQYGVSWGIADL